MIGRDAKIIEVQHGLNSPGIIVEAKSYYWCNTFEQLSNKEKMYNLLFYVVVVKK